MWYSGELRSAPFTLRTVSVNGSCRAVQLVTFTAILRGFSGPFTSSTNTYRASAVRWALRPTLRTRRLIGILEFGEKTGKGPGNDNALHCDRRDMATLRRDFELRDRWLSGVASPLSLSHFSFLLLCYRLSQYSWSPEIIVPRRSKQEWLCFQPFDDGLSELLANYRFLR